MVLKGTLVISLNLSQAEQKTENKNPSRTTETLTDSLKPSHTHWNPSRHTHWNQYQPIQTNWDQSSPNPLNPMCTHWNPCRPNEKWTDPLKPAKTLWIPFRPTETCPHKLEPVKTQWSYLHLLKTIHTHWKPCRPSKTCSGPSRQILTHQGSLNPLKATENCADPLKSAPTKTRNDLLKCIQTHGILLVLKPV